MTGLECLKEELIKRGYTKQQVSGKVVAGVLDILSKSNGEYTNLHEVSAEINEAEAKLKWFEMRRASIEREIEEERKDVKKLQDKTQEYIDKFYEAINKCETEEGRDALRIAQMFVNSINIDTCYDNTAYIKGLALILSRGNIAAMDMLERVEKNVREQR